MDVSKIKKILVVNPFGIGDVVFSFALVEALKELPSSPRVDFLCNERTEELVGLNPAIQERFVFNRDHLKHLFSTDKRLFFKELKSLLTRLRQERYDVLFDLSMGKEYAFFLMCLGIRKRIGFDYKGRGLF